ncbi:MAG: ABC transporter permease subunit [Propionibacteriaceae bacterium]|nr:ABC transporter permease subunit [Propionibacteriaceae bacterium]
MSGNFIAAVTRERTRDVADGGLSAGQASDRPAFGHSMRIRRTVSNVVTHVFLTIMAIIWIIPIVWVVMESFNQNTAPFTTTFFPTKYTLDNYVQLFTQTDVMNFASMFLRTLVIAIVVCVIQLFLVLSVAYCMSRLRFTLRRAFMNAGLTLGIFPGIMAVIALYYICKALGLTTSSWGTVIALIFVYSAGAGAGFYVLKGYMDTIPKSLDEAAMLDGCSRLGIFWRITIPITKPMIVYQALVGFLTPWLDFVAAKTIVTTQNNYTVSLGLWQMLQKEYIAQWFARFAAGAVCVSIPIAILFILMLRFYQESMSGAVKG